MALAQISEIEMRKRQTLPLSSEPPSWKIISITSRKLKSTFSGGGGIICCSPRSIGLIETWKGAGVPLEAVLRGIDAAFDQYDQRPSRSKKVNSLAYCSQAVLAAAEDMKEAAVGVTRREKARESRDSKPRRSRRSCARMPSCSNSRSCRSAPDSRLKRWPGKKQPRCARSRRQSALAKASAPGRFGAAAHGAGGKVFGRANGGDTG